MGNKLRNFAEELGSQRLQLIWPTIRVSASYPYVDFLGVVHSDEAATPSWKTLREKSSISLQQDR